MRRWPRLRNNAQELDILILQRNNLIAPRHEALLQGLFLMCLTEQRVARIRV
jgi:hypothetical protein